MTAPHPALERVRLSPLRRITIANLERSRDSTVPVTLVTHADAMALQEAKRRLGDVTYTVLLAKLLALELQEHPGVNVTLHDDAIERHSGVDLGVAVSTSDGNLVVPVVHGADLLPLAELATRLAALRRRADEAKLAPSDVRGATFTLSNIGMFLSQTVGVATIPPGQAGILLVSGIRDAVVAIDGQPAVRPLLPLSVTADHRAVNGEALAAFLGGLVERVEACDLGEQQ